jgi:hypothetical protein
MSKIFGFAFDVRRKASDKRSMVPAGPKRQAGGAAERNHRTYVRTKDNALKRRENRVR